MAYSYCYTFSIPTPHSALMGDETETCVIPISYFPFFHEAHLFLQSSVTSKQKENKTFDFFPIGKLTPQVHTVVGNIKCAFGRIIDMPDCRFLLTSRFE